MTVVVTGANGHLGGNLIERLVKTEDVRALVHRNVDALEGLPVEKVKGSVTDQASLRKAFRGADAVFHLAAAISIQGDPDGRVWKTNVDGVRNTAQAALDEGVERFVHVSSVHAFDLQHCTVVDETSPRSGPKNYAYDHSKAAGEAELRKIIDKGLDATLVNPTGVIGPRDLAPSRMGRVFLDLAERKLPALISGAFDFVDVRDVAQGIIAARERGETGANHLLGGHHLSVRDIATLAERVTGVPAPRMTLPQWMAYPAIPFARWSARRAGDQPRFTKESLGALRHGRPVDSSFAKQQLGHEPRSALQTVDDVYEDFRARGMWTP